jgi:hypothetical protein
MSGDREVQMQRVREQAVNLEKTLLYVDAHPENPSGSAEVEYRWDLFRHALDEYEAAR